MSLVAKATQLKDRHPEPVEGPLTIPLRRRGQRDSYSKMSGRERRHDAQRFHADRDDLADEADDVFLVVAIRVAADLALVIPLDAVLVDDPLERAAVAEAVVEDGGRDAFEGEEIVIDEGVLSSVSSSFDTPVEGNGLVLDALEGIFRSRFVVDVEVGELQAGGGEGVEDLGAGFGIMAGLALPCIFSTAEKGEEAGFFFAQGEADEGNARQFAFQVLGVAGAVGRMMQDGIDVMEDVFAVVPSGNQTM